MSNRLATVLTQQRHKLPRRLETPRTLQVAVPDMHSQVNLGRIVRAAALFGVTEMLAAGRAKMDTDVSLGAEEHVHVKSCRTLRHPLKRLQADGWTVVGLEQTEVSNSLFEYNFPRRCVLLVGHERHGVTDDLLTICDDIVEIPTFGHVGSHNASSAAMIAMYEYCRQAEAGLLHDDRIQDS